MKTIHKALGLFISLLFVACSSTQSLQEYYVDNSENPNFLSVDLPVSLLNLKKTDLSADEQEALESLNKMNVLAFKKDGSNEAEYTTEKVKVKAILKDPQFNELMKMNTPYGKATIKYLGDDDAIDEVIIYGDSKEKGFVLVRVLGNDMNPAHLAKFLKAIEKSDYKGQGLDKIGEFLKG